MIIWYYMILYDIMNLKPMWQISPGLFHDTMYQLNLSWPLQIFTWRHCQQQRFNEFTSAPQTIDPAPPHFLVRFGMPQSCSGAMSIEAPG